MMILLTLPDAAHIHRLPLSTIRRWLSEGKIKRYGKAKPWMVDAAEIDTLVSVRRDTLRVRAT